MCSSDLGIQALAVHGRTRLDAYQGEAEYETIAAVKSCVSIPVIANGDISSPMVAKSVLDYTQADGLMIGRAAQGNPWIFDQIKQYLANGSLISPPNTNEVNTVLTEHLQNLYEFYGEHAGVRIARKHIGWYLKTCYSPIGMNDSASSDNQDVELFRQRINQVDEAKIQLELLNQFFDLYHSSTAIRIVKAA